MRISDEAKLGYSTMVNLIAIDPVSVANLIIGTVAMVAACVAAYFTWKAPTKEDLARVERNTADTSQHLKAQAAHAELLLRANRVSIAVEAKGAAASPLVIKLSLRDTSVTLTHIDLFNEAQSLFGTFPCERINDLEFIATVSPVAMWKWSSAGTPVQSFNRVRLVLRVSMKLGDTAEVARQMAVIILSAQLPGANGHLEAFWLIEGEV